MPAKFRKSASFSPILAAPVLHIGLQFIAPKHLQMTVDYFFTACSVCCSKYKAR